jgi:hypothetical protein
MLTVYPEGHGKGPIVYRRSRDGGKTWSARLPVPDNWATSLETPTIHRTMDPRGRKRLVVFSGLYPVRRALSEDDGATWTPLEPVGQFGGIVAMSTVIRLRDGRYTAFFHDDGRFLRNAGRVDRFRVYATDSSDGGVTWSEPRLLLEHPEAHLCEPGVVRSPDGRQLAMLLRENSRKKMSFVSFSDDEGATWSAPRELAPDLTGDRHTAAYSKDGRLLVTFRDMAPKSPTRGDWIVWVGRYEDLRSGKPGQYRIRLEDNRDGTDCCYSGLESLPDGTLVATTYGHWTSGEQPYILSVRWRLKETDRILERSLKAASRR